MASYQIAKKITNKTEFGYNPGINEAETIFGVDRSENPNFVGWDIVDKIKAQYPGASVSQLNKLFSSNTQLMTMIDNFFKSDYWDCLKLDLVNDQYIANNCYDCSINEGSGIAAKFMQEAAGVTVDYIIGSKTITAINSGNAKTIYDKINALRKSEYLEIVTKNPKKQVNLHSWLSRLKEYGNE